jgi:hypothetical protein
MTLFSCSFFFFSRSPSPVFLILGFDFPHSPCGRPLPRSPHAPTLQLCLHR